MSTRGTIYFHDEPGDPLHLHIYTEMLDDPPNDIHMEITLPGVIVDIVLPVSLQERLGIKP